MRISDWSSDVCSSDLLAQAHQLDLDDAGHVLAAEPAEQDHFIEPVEEFRPEAGTDDFHHLVAGRLVDLLALGPGQILAAEVRGQDDHRVAEIHRAALTIGEPSVRSEEHTSELQSLMRISYAVFCLK